MNGDQDFSTPPAQQAIPVAMLAATPKKSGMAWKIILGVLLGLSVCANVLLVLMLSVAFAIGAGAGGFGITDDPFDEKVLEPGPKGTKVVSIRVNGLIDPKLAQSVIAQLKRAGNDDAVKAVILRIDSPGGYMTSSDEIHDAVLRLTQGVSAKPVVAFMQGMGTSGAYYISVPARTIIAEPTALTGSIGVIFQMFVIEGLLEDKLGITTVTIKSGEKKDVPSMFRQMLPEEREYIQNVLIAPFHERFVDIVTNGRKNLTRGDVERIADGRVFTADGALEEGLIDKVGYFDAAIEEARKLAGVPDARVVEYRVRTTLKDLLSLYGEARKPFDLDPASLTKLGVPRIMYLWSMN